MPTSSGFLKTFLWLFEKTWWVVTPLALFFIFWELWNSYVKKKFLLSVEWCLLEVKVPRNIEKTPKAMEQIFAGIHAILRSEISFKDKYFKGVMQEWFSFEIVGYRGDVYFLIKTPVQFRNLVEAQVYAQYPDAEIKETEDFFDYLPASLPNKEFDVWGTEIILAKDSAYPIRTYPYFEESQEEKRLDPLTVIAETIAKLNRDEIIWLQFLIKPSGEEWKTKAQELINKLAGRKKEKTSGLFDGAVDFARNLIVAPFEHPIWPEGKESSSIKTTVQLTGGEKDILEAIEDKISKLAFEGGIRFLYVDKASAFTRSNIVAVMGVFRQFNVPSLNSLKPNSKASTGVSWLKWFLKQRREYLKKKSFFAKCKKRAFMSKSAVFNTEELATMYHYPTLMVEAPTLRMVEARKGEPPADLPIE